MKASWKHLLPVLAAAFVCAFCTALAACSYTIKSGDTLWAISQTYKTTVDNLQTLNPGIVATNLQIGQVINVPCASGCQSVAGYTVAANVDHWGDDISNTGSLTAGAQACMTNPSCVGFNSNGWIKTKVTPTTASNGNCLYTKIINNSPTPAGCQSVSGYTAAANVDHWGDDISNAGSLTAAAQACSANPSCAGFNSDWWIKKTVTPTAPASRYCLYTKINNNPTPTGGFVYSPYKDVGIGMNWNTNVMGTAVTGQNLPVLQAMPSNLAVLTWAFANGQCGSENWAGVAANAMAQANVQAAVSAGKKYILSTGGAGGVFTCNSDNGFAAFVNRYMSSSLLGVDFDIEGGQSQSDITNLVQRVKFGRSTYPNLRFSFTLATGNGASGNQLNSLGTMVMNAIKAAGLGWTNVLINLMVMDYGGSVPDMGQSAINAAQALHGFWNVPYSSIELTPMIGGNDSPGETFTIANAAAVSSFVRANGLGGVHFWSIDRDRDCPPGTAIGTCNTYGQAGTLGFTKAFLTGLNL